MLISSWTYGQYNHTLSKSFNAEPELTIEHRRGPVKVVKSTDGKVSFEAEISFDADSETAAQQLKDAFEIKSNTNGSRIDIHSSMGIKNMKTINGKSTIELSNGSTIKGIKKLTISLLVKTPSLEKLKVDSRYESIEVEADVRELLVIQGYSSEIKTLAINGDLNLIAKYSKGTIGSFKRGQIELYESKIDFENAGETSVNAKYSTLKLPRVRSLSLTSYESKFYIGDVAGMVQINDKYSKFEFASLREALIDVYESNIMVAGKVNKVQVKSKYTDFHFSNVETIHFASSYEDDFTAKTVGSLRADASKYTDYKLGALTQSLDLDSYEDEISIQNPANSIESILIKGKYTTLQCPLSSELKFSLQMEAKYGSIDLDEDDLNYTRYVKKGDETSLIGTRNGVTSGGTSIAFDCYECKIRLKG